MRNLHPSPQVFCDYGDLQCREGVGGYHTECHHTDVSSCGVYYCGWRLEGRDAGYYQPVPLAYPQGGQRTGQGAV